jgi:hypothetical protein
MKDHIGSEHHELLVGWVRATFAVLALLVVAVSPARAGGGGVTDLGNPGIAPPQSPFLGLTYSEWAAGWFQWAYSMPSTRHPLFDNADCSEGQTSDVWFIDGRLGGVGFPPAGRDCIIPPGTALFLALAATYADNEGCDPTGTRIQRTSLDESHLRGIATRNLNGFLGTRGIVVDGVTVQGLLVSDPTTGQLITDPNTPYRVQSPVYDYVVPAFDNILIFDDGPCYQNPPAADLPGLTVHGAVADGVFVMIKPLPVGHHTIKFGPLDPATGEPTRLYNITVNKTVTGSASRVGVVPSQGKDAGAQVSFVESVGFAGVLNLGASSVTIERLLDEVGVGAVGELVKGTGGGDILPVTLAARPGGTANAAIFETPSGSRPSFRMEIKNGDPGKGLLELNLKLDRGTMPTFPGLCAGQPLATHLATSFTIDDGVNAPAVLSTIRAWRCSDLVGGDPQEPRSLRVP